MGQDPELMTGLRWAGHMGAWRLLICECRILDVVVLMYVSVVLVGNLLLGEFVSCVL